MREYLFLGPDMVPGRKDVNPVTQQFPAGFHRQAETTGGVLAVTYNQV